MLTSRKTPRFKVPGEGNYTQMIQVAFKWFWHLTKASSAPVKTRQVYLRQQIINQIINQSTELFEVGLFFRCI